MINSNGQLVSIVIATYNVVDLIENCLLSILAQTHKQIEIVVVDALSTDGTLEILERYADRIKWISEKDKGINDAQWKGVQRATGDWIYFLGADDYLASPRAFERLFLAAAENMKSSDILTGHALYEDGRIYRSNNPSILKWKNCIHGQGALYRRGLFAQKQYDVTLKVYYDYEFNLWALTSGKRFYHTSILLAILGCGGCSDKPKWKNYREDMRVRPRYIGGLRLLASQGLAVVRYLYKVAWFKFLRQL